MKIRPLQDRIIVKRLEGEEKTKGGIIISDSAKEKPMEGEVIAVGSGKVLENGKKSVHHHREEQVLKPSALNTDSSPLCPKGDQAVFLHSLQNKSSESHADRLRLRT